MAMAMRMTIAITRIRSRSSNYNDNNMQVQYKTMRNDAPEEMIIWNRRHEIGDWATTPTRTHT